MEKYGSWSEQVDSQFRTSGDNKVLTLSPPSSLTAASLTLNLPDVSGSSDLLISLTSNDIGANRLRNKDLQSDNVSFVDSGDLTKKLRFNISGITTGTTRTLVVPDASDTIILAAESQTLTNKTIDGDNNTISDLALSSIKATGNFSVFIQRDGSGNAIDSTKSVPAGDIVGNSDAQTLTNKAIDGDDNTITDVALSSLKTTANTSVFLQRDGSGDVIDSTKAVPTGDVVGTSDTQVITNKDIDGGTAANTRRITLPSDTTGNLNSLTRKAGTVVYDTTTGEVKFDNGTSLSALGTSGLATPTSAGTVSSYFPTIQSSVHTFTGGNYTVTTTDGYRTIMVDPGVGTVITLPAVADNEGRLLTVVQTGALNQVNFRAASGEVLNVYGVEATGTSTITVLDSEVKTVTLACDGNKWFVISGGAYIHSVGLNGVYTAGTIHFRKIGPVVHVEITGATWSTGGLERDTAVIVPSEIRPGVEAQFAAIGATGSGERVSYSIRSSGEVRARVSGTGVGNPPYNLTMHGSYILRG